MLFPFCRSGELRQVSLISLRLLPQQINLPRLGLAGEATCRRHNTVSVALWTKSLMNGGVMIPTNLFPVDLEAIRSW
jgi:hypothetical protein